MAESRYSHVSCIMQRGVLVLTVTEPRIQDDHLAGQLREEMLRAVTEFSADRIVVDLHLITDISSMAFRPLIALRRTLQDTGGKLILCGLSPPIHDIFYTTRLVSKTGQESALFDLDTNVDAAVERLSAAAMQP